LPEESDFEKFECSVFLGTEKLAAWDIAKCASFFVFRGVNLRINGRVIEAELVEDFYNELDYLEEKEQKRKVWKKIKWINSKLKIVLN
jgi:hypothetical protein